MVEISERLDRMKKTIQENDFLEGKGLSNEVNIRIFCYEEKDEMIVRTFTEHLKNESLKCKVQIVDLYELFLDICKDGKILDKIPQLEEKKGSEKLEELIERSCNAKKYAGKIMNIYNNCDVLLLTGVGKVFPFMRVHSLLNAIQNYMNDKPIVVLYPGAFDGHYLKLFNKLKPSEYYRAFNLI